ncbi:hypothetical protein [Mycolicibacterium hodleri]|uniref:Peptidase C39-like domain-containing protein n=1 Tax=Mycolicibacterium hodleri TaxID=49897 RepID=A0A502DZQ5_9MYCO|nr:hypothetical protein [Mycolicibacterium hodleri]TPG29766.1 hypothetical protein EAH80_26330 [Mycolicibacterium hodleri]
MRRVKIAGLRLQQRDGVSCGPAVAVVAGALLNPGYGAAVTDATWFGGEQGRVHAAANRIWPRALGTTPWGMAKAISAHGTRYRWRLCRRGDSLVDVTRAVTSHRPVAMLIGNAIPRHWVLIVAVDGDTLQCYEPSSGAVLPVSPADIRGAGLTPLGFPRAFAFVLPR